uniref:Uncharacterized protein n=1 Tax=Euplotes harpa TaxID=151035 RepID=A0A7S3N5I5_9SPIT|mmetsp:Transcript_23821/g.27409  ORF Transcript_23821/g.27409 Transcript_23821/m.27409 type:complete len:373 (+) Transcript_23821:755-1873(+)
MSGQTDKLRAKNYIDLQTKAILSEANYIHKPTGMYVMLQVVMEFILDDNVWVVRGIYLNPIFQTYTQVLYTVLTFLSSVILALFLFFNLKRTKDEYNMLIEELKVKILEDMMKENKSREESKELAESNRKALEDDKADDEDHEDEDENSKAKKKIKFCSKLKLWFRSPNMFEWIAILFMILFWISLVMKLIFHKQFQDIAIDESKFLDLSSMVVFQLTINSIDYILLVSTSFVMVCFTYQWFSPVNFIMNYLVNYIKRMLFAAFLSVFVMCIIAASFVTAIFGLNVYGYNKYAQSLVYSFTMLLRGSVFYPHEHFLYVEDYQHVTEKVGVVTLLFFLFSFHFYMRYFVLNVSVGSLLNEYKTAKTELRQNLK